MAPSPGWPLRYLDVTRQTVQFIPEHAVVDVYRFEALVSAASTQPDELPASPSASASVRLAQLNEAVSLYRGELLAGFSLPDALAFDEWLLLRREMLHQRALVALRALATEYEAQGDYQQAHAIANRWLALDLYREDPYRLIMRLLAVLGDPEQALRQFDQMRQRFLEELDVAPSQEMTALASQIAAGEFDKQQRGRGSAGQRGQDRVLHGATPPDRHPRVVAAPYGASSRLDLSEVPQFGPFFGRVDERRKIVEWLLYDGCRVVAILGMGGMGKTTLAARCVQELAGDPNSTNFDVILWRSLLNAPPLAELLPPLLRDSL